MMLSSRRITIFSWCLAALLAVAAAIFSIKGSSAFANGSATSFEPGGASALLELLRSAGYEVSITDTFTAVPPHRTIVSLVSREEWAQRPLIDDLYGSYYPVDKFLADYRKQNGNVLVFQFSPSPTQFVDRDSIRKATIRDFLGNIYEIRTQSNFSGAKTDSPDVIHPWQNGGNPTGAYISGKGGIGVVLDCGDICLNRYIDLADNARFILDAVKLVAKPGSQIIVQEAGHQEARQVGLLEIIGPWAEGAWIQIMLLGGIMVYTLGKRFGLAEEDSVAQRSSRDLVDGISDTYARQKAGKAALLRLVEDADARGRAAYRLPAIGHQRKRNETLPASLIEPLLACEAALQREVTQAEAVRLAQTLEVAMKELSIIRRTHPSRARR